MKTFYVASYGKGDDKGIYIVSFNEETKRVVLHLSS